MVVWNSIVFSFSTKKFFPLLFLQPPKPHNIFTFPRVYAWVRKKEKKKGGRKEKKKERKKVRQKERMKYKVRLTKEEVKRKTQEKCLLV